MAGAVRARRLARARHAAAPSRRPRLRRAPRPASDRTAPRSSPPTSPSAGRPPRRSACSRSTRSLSPRDARAERRRRGGSRPTPSSPCRHDPAACPTTPIPGSTCWPSATPPGRSGSLRPDLHARPHDVPGGDPHEHLGGGWHARGGPLRIGIGGPVGSGKTALVAALCRTLGDELRARRRHQRHLHHRGRRLPAPQRRAARRADRRRADRLLPAHRDPRRHHRQPRRGRRPRSSALPPLDLVLRRVRRRQPHRVVQQRASSTCSCSCVDVAGGDKVPRKGGPGVTGADLLVINKTDLAPLVGADLGGDGGRRAPGARRPAGGDDLAAGGPVGGRRRRLGARAARAPRQPAPAG